MTNVQSCNSQTQWDEYIIQHDGHPLQLWGWGEVKAAHNWKVDRIFIYDEGMIVGAAQLLIRPLPKPFTSLVYIPRGPVLIDSQQSIVFAAITSYAKKHYKAVAVTIEPDTSEPFALSGWKVAQNTILIPRTLVLDLTRSEDELQADMSKKTRQYIRKSISDGVVVRKVSTNTDIAKCLEIYKETAIRAGFSLHDDQYYYDIFTHLADHSPVFAAFHNEKMLAFLWPVVSRETLFELYGGMNEEGQRLRANYALKWHAIQTAKRWGIARYDMNGLLNDGVSTFKQGFASHETQLIGTFDYPLSPLYAVWSTGLPVAKKIIRTIKRS